MARDEGRVLGNREAGFAFQHTHGGERDRHQRRLGIFRQLQGLAWTVPDDVRQLLTERRIDLGEYRTRRRKSLRERLAHSDRLGTLTRKGECCRHTCPRTFLPSPQPKAGITEYIYFSISCERFSNHHGAPSRRLRPQDRRKTPREPSMSSREA